MSRPPHKVRRTIAIGCLGVAIIALALVARPAIYLISVLLSDSNVVESTPRGYADDASRLNQTAVLETIDVKADPAEAERQLAELVQRAAREHRKIAIAGARHTMGGHSICPDGIIINMRTFDRFELNESTNVLHASGGARWDQIIPYLNQRGRSIEIMQSNNSFTVGGSLSANCHGWQPNRPPIASSVLSIRLMRPDGTIVRCGRDENTELFSLVLGGYGLFGIILDADLKVIANERYQMQRFVIKADDFAEVFAREVANQPEVGMAYGRLCVVKDDFLNQAVFNVFRSAPCETAEIPPLTDPSLTSLKRAVFRGSADSDYGKELRWEAELTPSDRLSSTFVSRNQLLNDPVELYQNHSATSTDILHEYFISPQSFAAFLSQMREIIPKHECDLLNVTVRHVLPDPDSFLRYADQEMFALVLMFNQPRSDAADIKMQALTQELIDAALKLNGRYYLPYRLHASQQQFDLAYPQGRTFFELKRKYDPNELFQNEFYLKYGSRSKQ